MIGVTAYAEQARWGDWDAPAVLVPRAYVTPSPPPAGCRWCSRRCRTWWPMRSGGWTGCCWPAAPTSTRPCTAPNPPEHLGPLRPDRDAAEVELLAGAVDGGLPMLGVCRGMQLMNVVRGGSLVQHLPDAVGHPGHAEQPGVYVRHPVAVAGDTRLAGILGDGDTQVPSYHHQGIQRLGAGLVPTAWAPDGTVEGLEDPALPFCVAVQWHPEAGSDMSLFRALVEAASARLTARA